MSIPFMTISEYFRHASPQYEAHTQKKNSRDKLWILRYVGANDKNETLAK